MRDDFCVFILSHGRASNVKTYDLWRRRGYTGRMYVVIDNEDETADEYYKRFGNEVLMFDKSEADKYTETFDNFPDRRGVVWARNACWELSKQVGCRFFNMLDDDYGGCMYRRIGKIEPDGAPVYRGWSIHSLDDVLEAMVAFVETTPVMTLCMSQGGDHFGGASGDQTVKLTRKAMNSFICDNTKPFLWSGRINEDVNAYVGHGALGKLFYTYMGIQMDQTQTQLQKGGLTELYLDSGTYVKSFYTVIANPSCVTIRTMGRINMRLHHSIRWDHAVPKVLNESLRKSDR